ncbi:urease accessory protein UreE [Aurantimonas sp. C2-6-R+9]|uniref:urease accessory protein UreE n=1 Tax=unclassified Aurantimonas TaxID=2638230 RepID=UPI002E188EC5|nr:MULTISPECIES: urease accessory protein UreE [unclassified Aurantimonas]MEC5290332.1 urease accessory protein UreE [Aurantimonas sp. C2-3-R2]MEC5322711.1 urease accessory protein UreE [Aurantimonas sp. A3-2-R12]MEC5379836.1 urease accessory protein UreE [Aurantimonas sp. C2-6-R+9]MEC5411412.1 urease accessory protein UreE [Aurantimonas sp. C2-4-R8]
MIVGTSVKRAGEWTDAADTITLDETARHRRRMAMVSDDDGIAFLLDLPEAVLLRDGDAIGLDDGRLIAVRAKPEELYEVRGKDARHLLVLAWQIGNRHLPAQLLGECILIRRDPVIYEMLSGLGATITEVAAGFDPEGGAYEAHGHDHEPSPETAIR